MMTHSTAFDDGTYAKNDSSAAHEVCSHTILSHFEFCQAWLDTSFFEAMAKAMQEEGRSKGVRWVAWKFTPINLLK